jgi:hypothetical protein
VLARLAGKEGVLTLNRGARIDAVDGACDSVELTIVDDGGEVIEETIVETLDGLARKPNDT